MKKTAYQEKKKALYYGDVVPGSCAGGFSHTGLLQQILQESQMDPQTLPSPQKELYHIIKKQYKVSFEPFSIGDIRLNILRASDLEQLLDGRDPLQDVSAFPFWSRLWEAAIVLSEFIAGQNFPAGTTVLELGAGLGVPGMTAAERGCTVTLSDYEEMIVNFQQVSAAASGLNTMRFTLLDWLNPPEMEQYDIILGAEILFRKEFFQPLLTIMDKALKPGGKVFLAHDIRRQSLQPFLQMAEANYQISAQKRKLKSLEEDKEILLTRLVAR